MKISEAPPPGWYPDPTAGTRLRWWDGSDWTDRFRSRPNLAAPASAVTRHPTAPLDPTAVLPDVRRLADDVVAQARLAARAEVDRATDQLTKRLRAATSGIDPLISRATNRLMRWVRIAVILAVVLLVGWIVLEVFASTAFFDWLGERIDNATTSSGRSAVT